MSKTPLGRLDRAAFGMLEIPRLERSVLDGFRALGDGAVRPGDLVIADEVGVCFVPFERAAEVLQSRSDWLKL